MINKYALDFKKVLDHGAQKYGLDGWLDPEGVKTSKKDQVKCFASHAAEYYSGVTEDDESGLHPSLHIMCRAFMVYVRYKEGLDK